MVEDMGEQAVGKRGFCLARQGGFAVGSDEGGGVVVRTKDVLTDVVGDDEV